MSSVKLIECPRDALQGVKTWVPTDQKIRYYQSLLQVGFDTLDVGSFVSPKAIPQMKDTAAVIQGLDLSKTKTQLLTIVANLRGAQAACQFPEITYLGFPFSISENFQMRNTHKTISESVTVLQQIVDVAHSHQKQVVVYLSMGFGNPYGDPWSTEIVGEWTATLSKLGIQIISLSDTIGTAQPDAIRFLFSHLIPAYPDIEFGAHFHTHPNHWLEKITAAYDSGCRRFDGAIQGYGGCPMAKDDLIGNMPTEKLLSFCTSKNIPTALNPLHFEAAYNKATDIFSQFV